MEVEPPPFGTIPTNAVIAVTRWGRTSSFFPSINGVPTKILMTAGHDHHRRTTWKSTEDKCSLLAHPLNNMLTREHWRSQLLYFPTQTSQCFTDWWNERYAGVLLSPCQCQATDGLQTPQSAPLSLRESYGVSMNSTDLRHNHTSKKKLSTVHTVHASPVAPRSFLALLCL